MDNKRAPTPVTDEQVAALYRTLREMFGSRFVLIYQRPQDEGSCETLSGYPTLALQAEAMLTVLSHPIMGVKEMK